MVLEKCVDKRSYGRSSTDYDQNANKNQQQNDWGEPPFFSFPEKRKKIFEKIHKIKALYYLQ
jgi:hypothetical protein